MKGWHALADIEQILTIVPSTLSRRISLIAFNAKAGERDLLIAAAGGLPCEVMKNWRVKAPNTFNCEFGFCCTPWCSEWSPSASFRVSRLPSRLILECLLPIYTISKINCRTLGNCESVGRWDCGDIACLLNPSCVAGRGKLLEDCSSRTASNRCTPHAAACPAPKRRR